MRLPVGASVGEVTGFMGNSAARAFRDEPVGTGTLTGKLGKCITPSAVSQEALKLSLSTKGKQTNILDARTGQTLFSATSSMGLMSVTMTVTDEKGVLVCVCPGKNGMSKASFRVLRPSPAYEGQPAAKEKDNDTPLFPFAICTIQKGFSSTTATYSLVKADAEGDPMQVPLYEAKKLGAMAFLLSVENMEGTLVAKVGQESMMNSKSLGAEVGKGVDITAVMILAAMIGAATGSSGAAVGGLAGAGVV